MQAGNTRGYSLSWRATRHGWVHISERSQWTSWRASERESPFLSSFSSCSQTISTLIFHLLFFRHHLFGCVILIGMEWRGDCPFATFAANLLIRRKRNQITRSPRTKEWGRSIIRIWERGEHTKRGLKEHEIWGLEAAFLVLPRKMDPRLRPFLLQLQAGTRILFKAKEFYKSEDTWVS